MKEQVQKHFSRYVEFSKIEIDKIYSKLIPKTYQKKESND